MAVKCDLKRHCTRREDQGNLSAITEERFKSCSEERAIIVQTEQGRVGLCVKHLPEFHEARIANEGKPSAELKPWARLRRGIVIMGDEVPIE